MSADTYFPINYRTKWDEIPSYCTYDSDDLFYTNITKEKQCRPFVSHKNDTYGEKSFIGICITTTVVINQPLHCVSDSLQWRKDYSLIVSDRFRLVALYTLRGLYTTMETIQAYLD